MESYTMKTLPTPQLAVRFGRSKNVVAVSTLREASDAWIKLREEYNLGASQSPQVTVIDTVTGKTVARISYNGRAWTPGNVLKSTEIKL